MNDSCEDKTEEFWQHLTTFLAEIPRPVKLVVWADEASRWEEQEMLRLSQAIANKFNKIIFEARGKKPNYDFYPVLGIMGFEEEEEVDFGVRIIGLPTGVQITSLIGAIQAVSFRGQQLEPITRIQLKTLNKAIDIELVTDGQDESGTVMATRCFSFAVAHPKIRTFLIMADTFPTVLYRHNIQYVPHTILNDKIHIDGVLDEVEVLKHMAKAIADKKE